MSRAFYGINLTLIEIDVKLYFTKSGLNLNLGLLIGDPKVKLFAIRVGLHLLVLYSIKSLILIGAYQSLQLVIKFCYHRNLYYV